MGWGGMGLWCDVRLSGVMLYGVIQCDVRAPVWGGGGGVPSSV